jgi:hypothetical protein
LLLIKDFLARKHVSLVLLQKLSGKCISLSAAVPAARLFTNELNMAISKAARATKPLFITSALRQEVEHWLFLESWSGFLPWKTEKRHQVKIYSDASSYAWGGVLNPDEISVVISDYWPDDDLTKDIVTKEALALSRMLSAFADHIKNSWVDVYVYSLSLVQSWNSQGARSHSFAEALKSVFVVASFANIHLNLLHIPSGLNVADPPSRTLSLQDTKLAGATWATIQRHFGGQFGHSIDLMALPSNAMVDFQGSRLPFISPFPTPGCLGVNFFAQSPLHYPSNIFSNPYAFPPILLIPRVLRYLLSLSLPFTMVVPDVLPRCSWWPVIQAASHASILLGQRGNTGLLLALQSVDFHLIGPYLGTCGPSGLKSV